MVSKASVGTVLLIVVWCAAVAQADVFHLGPGYTSLETVTVGDPGNASDPWTWGPGEPRDCGAVNYIYSIGKYEVTAGQYTAFLNAVGGVDTYGLYNLSMSSTPYGCGIQRSGGGTVSNPYRYTVAMDYANRPVNYVSWGDAARFANWLHHNQPTGGQNWWTTETGAYWLDGATSDASLAAIPRSENWKWAVTSEDEWYKAAYYKGGSTNAGYWDFPTRSDTLPGRDIDDLSGNNANCSDQPYAGLEPTPIDSGKYLCAVGEFQNSPSPYGTFDQGGNVEEWHEAIMPIGDDDTRGYRGSSYISIPVFMQSNYRIYHGVWDLPSDEFSFRGFRVVSAAPEPASLILLLIGGLCCVIYNRHLRQRCS